MSEHAACRRRLDEAPLLHRLRAAEQERDWYRSALLEIASGRRPGFVNSERWHVAAKRFIGRARSALRRATELTERASSLTSEPQANDFEVYPPNAGSTAIASSSLTTGESQP